MLRTIPSTRRQPGSLRFVLVLTLLAISGHLLALSGRYRAMWRDDPATTMVIGWEQLSGTDPVLYYDTRPHGRRVEQYPFAREPDRVVAFRGMHNHFVRLTGLTPDTEYHFLIVDSEGSSRRMNFRTAPAHPSQPLSIVAGGDSRNHREARRLANQLVAKIRPHVVLFGGDFTASDTDQEWRDWMDDWQETLGPDGRLTPILATRGNHEYSNRTLHQLFDVPTESGYYALSFGGGLLRVYTLNSMIPAGGDQRAWLEADLEASLQTIWRIAQYHHSMRPHTANKREKSHLVEQWAGLFYRYGVRLVIEGDSHVVKTTWPIRPTVGPDNVEGFVQDLELGTVYVGEGCWGAPLRSNNDDKPWTRASGSFNQFKWIIVRAEGMEVRTLPTDASEQALRNTDQTRLKAPLGLVVWNPGNGSVVRIRRTRHTYPLPPMRAPQTIGPTVASFTATPQDSTVELRWSARHLPAGTIFELQRSLDGGNHFEIIGHQPSSIEQHSHYRHIETLPPDAAARARYRLQYLDDRGSPVYLEAGPPPYASPAGKPLRLSFHLPRAGNVRLRLLDRDSREVREVACGELPAGDNQQMLDCTGLPAGHYEVLVELGDEVVRRIPINR